MCRILLISGSPSRDEKKIILSAFHFQAKIGMIPKGDLPGHKDGWGFCAYKNKRIVLCEKNYTDATTDQNFQKTTQKIADNDLDIIIGHLRKSAVGKVSFNNTHPFIFLDNSFCHNGILNNSQKLPIKILNEQITGETDSEHLFFYLLENIKPEDDFTEKFKLLLEEIRKTYDYTALNCLFSNGTQTIALRDVNLANKEVIDLNLLEYYTLYTGTSNDGRFTLVASEKIELPNIKWRLMQNREFLIFN